MLGANIIMTLIYSQTWKQRICENLTHIQAGAVIVLGVCREREGERYLLHCGSFAAVSNSRVRPSGTQSKIRNATRRCTTKAKRYFVSNLLSSSYFVEEHDNVMLVYYTKNVVKFGKNLCGSLPLTKILSHHN